MTEASYVPHFVSSIRAIFGTMIPMELTIGKATTGAPADRFDITGCVGFSGEVSGAVAVRMGERVAKAVVRSFSGYEGEMGSADFRDAVGEIVNLIAGGAKASMNRERVSIGTPSVVVGNERGDLVRCGTIVTLACVLACGTFHVEVGVEDRELKAAG